MVRAATTRLAPRTVARADALGLVLAADVIAHESVPPFANTAVDGYAVQAADVATASDDAPVRLAVVGELPAGQAPSTAVAAGQAIRIMTGAPIPPGADAVVMVERTTSGPDHVLVHAPVAPGDNVRRAGGDVEPGAVVFAAGTVLHPAHLGVLASLDHAEVSVFPRPRVGVLSTGDELVESGPLAPGKIRDSNRPLLLAVLTEAGCEPVDLGTARDDEATIHAAIARGVDSCDALLTSGAVSVGDYDFVKVAIERLVAERGGSYQWSQVAIKPAKPFAFGTVVAGERTVPVFGLPGNPVSSHVSFELFARPALRTMAGHTSGAERPVVTATAAAAMGRRPDGKTHFDRVRVWVDGTGALCCERSGDQASNVLSGMAAARGLAVLADGQGVQPGGTVAVMLLTDLV